jgi:acyl-CoA thioesterase-1
MRHSPGLSVFAALCCSLALCYSGLTRAGQATILVLGDSLSAAYNIPAEAGWVALLQAQLRDQGLPYTVVNASISGDTTRGGRARLPAALEAHQPDIVIVELGGNDGLRGIRFGEMRENLRAIAEQAQHAGAKVLLLGVHMPGNYGPVYDQRFRAVYLDVAEALDLAFVPNFLDGVTDDASLLQEDLLHPTAEAQPRLLDNVLPTLLPLLAPPATSSPSAPRAPAGS